MFLMACGVESVSTSAQPSSISSAPVAGDRATSADPARSSGELGLLEVCDPGDEDPCCNIPGGCGCPGIQTCGADGNYGACIGATRVGTQCP
jgi:hypothetical protein